jgi:hypothetical protein
MGGGSLKSALGRKADIVAGALTRVVLALDAAKVRQLLYAAGWLGMQANTLPAGLLAVHWILSFRRAMPAQGASSAEV